VKRLLLCAAALLAASPALAETIAIVGGKVAIGDGSQPIEAGTVVIRDGRIAAAGAGVATPAGARVIDATGKWVSPGLFVGMGPLGLVEVGGVPPSNDARGGDSPFSAAIDVTPSINPRVQPIQVTRAEGFTRAIVAPSTGKSIFAGQGAVIDLGTDMDAITRSKAFQYIELGEHGGEAVGGGRSGAFAFLRNALKEAQTINVDGGFEKKLSRLDAEALVPVVTGKMPLFVHVERGSDILTVLNLPREFPSLKIVLVGASEGWTVAPQIAAAKVPVIAAGLNDLPDSFEMLAATQSNVGRMKAAGVHVALRTSRSPVQEAGNLVGLSRVPGATGLDWGSAFATITSAPAEVIGMSNELGALLPGRRADVVIWDGDPLEVESGVLSVYIDGVEQPLTNHMSKLRDRYRQSVEGALPKAYQR
jgi:imidazolonepropionase-like amidohydrolase